MLVLFAVGLPLPTSSAEIDVSLNFAKVLAVQIAADHIADPYLSDARLYRNLDDSPAVWVLEFHSAPNDAAYTVVAAASRSLPPIVMHWQGVPWHSDPLFLSRAQAVVGGAQGREAREDWNDLRWEGPFDLWVPRLDEGGGLTFAGVRTPAELTRQEIASIAAQRAERAAAMAARVSTAWADVDRHSVNVLSDHPRFAPSPQYGYTRYIPRVPYLYQGDAPDCGIVSMMDILLYYDSNGFPNIVDEADLSGLRSQLRALMQWTPNGTYAHMNVIGTQNYLQARGVSGFSLAYHARSNYPNVNSTDMSPAQFTAEVDAGRPVQFLLSGYQKTNITDQSYGNHFVCGVGYYSGSVGGSYSAFWAIIHDNWKGSFANPYLNPDDPYVDYNLVNAMIKVMPPVAPQVPASTIAIQSPTNNATVNIGTATSFSVRVTTAPSVAVSNVTFKVGDAVLRSVSAPDSNQPSGQIGVVYSVSWTPSFAGTYNLSASALDSQGRSVQASTTVVVPVANIPPSIGWSSPQYENTQLPANIPVNLSVVASDIDGSISSVDYYLIGSAVTSLGRVVPAVGSNFITLQGVKFTAVGSFTLRATATDSRGATTSAERQVVIVSGSVATNDNFQAATPLSAGGDVVNTNSGNATKEVGEPSHAGDVGGRSLWWKWTPGAGTAVVTTRGSNFDTLLGVYTGSSLGGLTVVASSDDDADSSTSYVRFTSAAGTTYYIAVDGYRGASGNVNLTALHSSTAAQNDNFASRTILTGTAATVAANNIVASKETGEPAHAGSTGGRSLWWSWTAPDSGNLLLSTSGSTFDTVLAVYTGSSVGALTTVGFNDDGGANRTSALTVAVSKGTTYQIAVDGYNGANGRVQLALTFAGISIASDASSTWTKTSVTGLSEDLRAVCYGAGKFVAAGLYATCSSTDGKQWIRSTSGFSTMYASSIAFGANRFVAVGGNYSFASASFYTGISYSADGVSWYPVSMGRSEWMNSVAFGAGKFVAVGQAGIIWSSSDGQTWSVVQLISKRKLNSVCFDGGVFLAVGESGTALASMDGANWYDRSITDANSDSVAVSSLKDTEGSAVVSGADGWYVISSWILADYSAGVSWNSQTLSRWQGVARTYFPYKSSSPSLASISGGRVLMTFPSFTGGPDVAISTDGKSWSSSSLGVAGGGPLRAATEANGRIVIVGDKGQIFHSSDGPPAIARHPQAQSLTTGGAISLSVIAYGTGPFSYQWRRNGTPILGATSDTFLKQSATAADSGDYTVAVANSRGSVTSSVATVSVQVPFLPPVIVQDPVSQSVTQGTVRQLSVRASGTPAPTYQWLKNGVPIAGATSDSLDIIAVGSADAGLYSVVATNSVGSSTSRVANVQVLPTSRLSNLSVRSSLQSGQTLIVGAVISGGSKGLLLRAAGPALNQFGLSGLPDPVLELYAGGSQPVAVNNDWSGSLAPLFQYVGAFGFVVGSKDAALNPTMAGAFTAQVKGVGSGSVLVEAYDVSSEMSPRLVNLSARHTVGTGEDILIAGFYLAGYGRKQVLIRAVGPTLAAFGVSGALMDPQLEVLDGYGGLLGINDNWPATLSPVFSQVGAFALQSGSKDAALLISLPANVTYTVKISGVNGATGEALIEIYEIF